MTESPRDISSQPPDDDTQRRAQIEREAFLALRTIIEQAPVGIFQADIAGNNLFANDELAQIVDRPVESMRGQGWLDHVHPRDRQQVSESWIKAILAASDSHGASGSDRSADPTEPELRWSVEFRIVRPAGEVRWVAAAARPMRDERGEMRGWLGSYTDITERQRARRASEDERRFLDALLESLAEGIVACDGDGRLSLFNRSAREFHGLGAQPLPPEQWAEHYDLYCADGVTPMKLQEVPLFRALAGQVVRDVEMSIVPRGQPPRKLLASGRAIVDDEGNRLGAVVAMHDITDRVKAEQETVEKARLYAREHEVAIELQRSLLPQDLPRIPGMSVVARYLPGTDGIDVGGDWYDVFPLAGGRFGVALGDVAGHGIRAASVMGQMRMALRAIATEEVDPALTLDRLNRLVHTLLDGEMATLLYMVWDPASLTASYVRAGHPPALVLRPDGSTQFADGPPSPPLGAVEHRRYLQKSLDLASGSTLFLFSDGLFERRGFCVDESLSRLARSVASGPTDLADLCDATIAALLATPTDDDVAMLALRVDR
ncbi:MAG: SpoIIE family protein phosphatase [Acidimicrobiales bacterium]